MVQRQIKVFSHNDLDGFGAPYLLTAVQELVFPDEQFEITNIAVSYTHLTLPTILLV